METEDRVLKDYGTISEPKVEKIGEEYSIDDISVVEIESIGLWTAVKEITLKAIPSVLMLFIVNGVIFFSNFFIGLKGDSITLTGCGLGAITINMVILSLDFGICDGMDALVSRAYGRRDFQSWEIYLNQWRYMILMLAIPQFLIILFLESIYDALGQPPKIAHSAWIFWIITFPGYILMNLFECNRRYLVWWEVYNAGTIINGITFALHIILLYITVIQFDLGIYGAGFSTTLIFTLDFVLFEIYRRFQVDEVHLSRWRLPSKLMLSHSYEFLHFAIPWSITIILSWWPIEILAIKSNVIRQGIRLKEITS